MQKIMAVLATLALSACMPTFEPRKASDISWGTVVDLREPWVEETNSSYRYYDDPLAQDPGDEAVIRLDDGSTVGVLAGMRELEPGQRVRVYRGEGAAFLL